MGSMMNHEEIKIRFIPYTINAVIKNAGKTYTEFFNDVESIYINNISYISKYDLKTLDYIQKLCQYKLLEQASFNSDFIRDKSIENGFLNNINMSINIDINDSIRFNIEDSVLYVTLNKEFFYFLNSSLTEFKDFFFNKVLLNLFNFFTEDNVFNSMLYNSIHDQIVSSNHNKINKDNYVF
jgi:hypothetical protein